MSEQQRAAEQLYKGSQYLYTLAAILLQNGHAVASSLVSGEALEVHKRAEELEHEAASHE